LQGALFFAEKTSLRGVVGFRKPTTPERKLSFQKISEWSVCELV
jgi:hypothetical protein